MPDIKARGKNVLGFILNKPVITEVYPRVKGVSLNIKIFILPPLDILAVSLSIILVENGIHLGFFFIITVPA